MLLGSAEGFSKLSLGQPRLWLMQMRGRLVMADMCEQKEIMNTLKNMHKHCKDR